jgi:hypothetical protein
MPHYPQPTVATPAGATCQGCGTVIRMFMCPHCGSGQWLVVPGAQMPSANVAGMNQALAPVVQAPQGSSNSTLIKLFEPLMKGLGESAGQAIFS